MSSLRFLVEHCLEEQDRCIIEIAEPTTHAEVITTVLTNGGKFAEVDGLAVEAFDSEFESFVEGRTMELLTGSRRLRVVRVQAPSQEVQQDELPLQLPEISDESSDEPEAVPPSTSMTPSTRYTPRQSSSQQITAHEPAPDAADGPLLEVTEELLFETAGEPTVDTECELPRSVEPIIVSVDDVEGAINSLPSHAEATMETILTLLASSTRPELMDLIEVSLAKGDAEPESDPETEESPPAVDDSDVDDDPAVLDSGADDDSAVVDSAPPSLVEEGSELNVDAKLMDLATALLRLNQHLFPSRRHINRTAMLKLLSQLNDSGSDQAEAVLQKITRQQMVVPFTRDGEEFLKSNRAIMKRYTTGLRFPQIQVADDKHVDTPAAMLGLCGVLHQVGWQQFSWKDLMSMMSLLSFQTPKTASAMHTEMKYLQEHGLLEEVSPGIMSVIEEVVASPYRLLKIPAIAEWKSRDSPKEDAEPSTNCLAKPAEGQKRGSGNGGVDVEGLDPDSLLLLSVISSLYEEDKQWPDRDCALVEITKRDRRFKFIGLWNNAWDDLRSRNIIKMGKPITLWSAEEAAAVVAASKPVYSPKKLEQIMLDTIREAEAEIGEAPHKSKVVNMLIDFSKDHFTREVRTTVLDALTSKGYVEAFYCKEANDVRLKVNQDVINAHHLAESIKAGTKWVNTNATTAPVKTSAAWGSTRAPPATLGGATPSSAVGSSRNESASPSAAVAEGETTAALTSSTPKRPRDDDETGVEKKAAEADTDADCNGVSKKDDDEALPERRSRVES